MTSNRTQRFARITELKEQLDAAYAAEEKLLHEEAKELDERMNQWKLLIAKIEKTNFPSVVKLNVGGKVFATSLATLTKYPNSYFGVMFSERWNTKPAEDGCYFIDKNPNVFHIILDYLRGEELDLEITPTEKKHLIRDAQFYQLEELAEMLEGTAEFVFTKSPNGDLSNNNKTFTKNRGGTGWNCNTLGSRGCLSGIHQWLVTLENNCTNLMIGVAPASTNQSGTNYTTCGFYFYACNGTLYSQDNIRGKAYYNLPCHVQSTKITVKLDMNAKTLTFAVNGNWLPVAFTNLPSTTLFPSFDVYDNGSKFTIDQN